MPLRAVTLDAAGTLVAPAAPVGVTYARVASAHGLTADAAAVERRFRAAFAAAPPLAFPGVAPADLAAHERGWWRTVVAAALDAPPGAALDATFDALYAHYAHADAWRVFPDVRPVLAVLRRRGLRLAVVSNFDARLPALLEALDLAPAVDAVIFSTGAGSAKPAPAIFHAAVRSLDVAPGDAVHVGDDPRADARGALDAGLGAILIARGAPPRGVPAGVRVVASLEQVAGG